MLYSGAELIKTSGQQAERLQRMKPLEAVRPVDNPAGTGSSLNHDTQNALLRFARFVHREGQQGFKRPPPKSNKRPNARIPEGYAVQLEAADPQSRSGGMINVYV